MCGGVLTGGMKGLECVGRQRLVKCRKTGRITCRNFQSRAIWIQVWQAEQKGGYKNECYG